MTLLLTALGVTGFFGPLLLRALGVLIPTRLIVYIMVGAVVLFAFGRFTGWIDGLHREIAVAQGQRLAAVIAFARAQQDLVMARVNETRLTVAMVRQSGLVIAQGARDAENLASARNALVAAQRQARTAETRAAALRQPLTRTAACDRFQEVDRRVMESTR